MADTYFGWLAVGRLCTRYEADLWLLRLDATGDVRWQARLALGPLTEFRGMAEADDGTLALSVRSGTTVIGSTSWLMFVDPEGRCLDTVR